MISPENIEHDEEDLSTETSFLMKNEVGVEHRLFVYGTLMHDRNVKMLLGRNVKSEVAILNNYIRIAPSWSFPFVVPQAHTKTQGRILFDLTDDELNILDKFEDEGNLYWRQRVNVTLENGDKTTCYTYVGRVDKLQASFGKEVNFNDRFSTYLENKIGELLGDVSTDRPDIHRRVLQELMGSAVDTLIESVFEGDYLCNYIMIATLNDAKPPHLLEVLQNEALRPYAPNYLHLVVQHIVLNQFIDHFRAQSPNYTRIDDHYLKHGIALLMALIYYNIYKEDIERLYDAYEIRSINQGRSYRDLAAIAIDIADEMYDVEVAESVMEEVDESWYSAPTPLGAELEFSNLGVRAVSAQSGDDPDFDSFYWFSDFDLMRRMWRLGGHVDSHSEILNAKTRNRGFLEYALGRYQIVGDLSRPLFVCPWALGRIVNELVKFQEAVRPHSVHISMEISNLTGLTLDQQHNEESLACLLLLGGDIRPDADGILREWRIWNRELCLDPASNTLNFLSRKIHYSRAEDETSKSEVLEFKFLRLFKEDVDYEAVITALKGYVIETNARPITAKEPQFADIPEHAFLNAWATHPTAVDDLVIEDFLNTVRNGLLKECQTVRLDPIYRHTLTRISKLLHDRNNFVRDYIPSTPAI